MKSLVLAIQLFVVGFCYGQSQLSLLITPAAGSFQHSSLRVVWTLGEVGGGSAAVGGLVVHQGYIQPAYFSVTQLDAAMEEPEFSVYPNPASEYFIIARKTPVVNEEMTYNLYDASGMLLKTLEPDLPGLMKVDLSDYPSGTYFLVVVGTNAKGNSTFKIIKGNQL